MSKEFFECYLWGEWCSVLEIQCRELACWISWLSLFFVTCCEVQFRFLLNLRRNWLVLTLNLREITNYVVLHVADVVASLKGIRSWNSTGIPALTCLAHACVSGIREGISTFFIQGKLVKLWRFWIIVTWRSGIHVCDIKCWKWGLTAGLNFRKWDLWLDYIAQMLLLLLIYYMRGVISSLTKASLERSKTQPISRSFFFVFISFYD